MTCNCQCKLRDFSQKTSKRRREPTSWLVYPASRLQRLLQSACPIRTQHDVHRRPSVITVSGRGDVSSFFNTQMVLDLNGMYQLSSLPLIWNPRLIILLLQF
ncbi:unnamed protein product [Arctia plantaginis]|uniref:Uncharacterized protein n=1 Tax=Arctia plantaginis TaxID=874455 RepID=A0A8S0ZRA7_ARCPL|nr:unnamed protein product [Arctia plantaginis]